MKPTKSDLRRKFHSIPEVQFEEQTLTSFSGLLLYQLLFSKLNFKKHLRQCFRHLPGKPQFGPMIVFLQLVLHSLLGYRQLRQQEFYRDDPLVKRILGLTQLPDVATMSRTLARLDTTAIAKLQALLRNLTLNRLRKLSLTHLTLDFDGTVIGCGRQAEGSAIGFNRKKKGQRSYYPLFCTIAQLGQVFDVLHRSGNVHDSNGAKEFILRCVHEARKTLPNTTLELRMDAAFFSDDIVSALDVIPNLEYSISVPFARFAELKSRVSKRKRWRPIDDRFSYFEDHWKPGSWALKHRFIFLRQQVKQQNKAPLQLDLFEPIEYGQSHTVLLTNKTEAVDEVMAYHHGRGSQEGLFAELKSHNQLDYIPSKNWHANQAYLLAVVFAHNLNRELQMTAQAPMRKQSPKRQALWVFEKLSTQRNKIIQRAGRLLKPQGKLTLSMAANDAVQGAFLNYIARFKMAG